jgi:hypothetical protein
MFAQNSAYPPTTACSHKMATKISIWEAGHASMQSILSEAQGANRGIGADFEPMI